MICPTCENAIENKCCQCGKRIWKKNQSLEPHPYYSEMCTCEDDGYDDCTCHNLHLICGPCSRDMVGDI